MALSISKWEVSQFGGYKKLLWDYPMINLGKGIEFSVPINDKTEDLGYYSSRMLIKLFLLKVRENKLEDNLLKGATQTEMKEKNWYGRESVEKVVKLDKTAISSCVNSIVGVETELSNLFIDLKDVITASDIYFPLPEDKKNKNKCKGEKEDGSGEGDGEEGDEPDGGNPGDGKMTMSVLQAFKAALEQTQKYTPSGMYLGNDYLGGKLSKDCDFVHFRKHTPIELNSTDQKMANELAKTLDITFDPQEDRINTLRSGKLDVRRIAEIPSGNTSVYYRIEKNQSTRPFSVCILGDESGSMSGYNIANQKRLMKILFNTFNQILPADKIFVYGHSDSTLPMKPGDTRRVRPGIFVYNDKYNPNFYETIDHMQARSGNYDGPVIEAVYKKVREFTDDNIIFISISDGQPAGSGYGGQIAIDDMKRIIEKCKRDGFVTVGIGFNYCGVSEIYNYHTIIKNFSDMTKQVSGIVNRVVKTEFQD
jgi:hypothetical protein